MTKQLGRKVIDQLTPYVPGKPIEDVKREYGIQEVTRLASNENAFGPSSKAIEAMKEAVNSSWLYPEPTCRNLREKLGALYGLSPEKFVTGNGADHLITLTAMAFIDEGDEVIYSTPTFGSYRESTLTMGGTPVEVPLTEDYIYNLDGILEKITDKTKLVYICNPNNPTGTILEPSQIEAFLKKVPAHVLVVIDEAYVEFINKDNYRTGVDFIKDGHQVLVLRTFSKLYGIAGTRIGYAMGNEDALAPLNAVRPTFEVNRIAVAGAEATLDDLSYSKEVLSQMQSEIERVGKEYTEMGFEVIGDNANFIFVDIKEDAAEMSEALLKKGLIIRPCTPWRLTTHIRISIGTPEQNDLLIDTIKEIRKAELV